MKEKLDKAAKEEKAKKERAEQQRLANIQEEKANAQSDEADETDLDSVGFLKKRQLKQEMAEKEAERKKKEEEEYQKQMLERESSASPLASYTDQDNDDIMALRNSMVQQGSDNMIQPVKKKKKGLFSKMEEKIQQDEDKLATATQDAKEQVDQQD